MMKIFRFVFFVFLDSGNYQRGAGVSGGGGGGGERIGSPSTSSGSSAAIASSSSGSNQFYLPRSQSCVPQINSTINLLADFYHLKMNPSSSSTCFNTGPK